MYFLGPWCSPKEGKGGGERALSGKLFLSTLLLRDPTGLHKERGGQWLVSLL